MNYKTCGVPQCKNTTIKTPEKLFISVPKKQNIRNEWMKLAQRDPQDVLEHTTLYFCEDHFDLPNVMKNYTKYKMGRVKRVHLIEGVLPSKFHCQLDRRKKLGEEITQQEDYIERGQIEPHTSIYEEVNVKQEVIEFEPEEDHLRTNYDEETSTESNITAERSVQVVRLVHFRSKSTQVKNKSRDVSTSPREVFYKTSSTSPFKIHTSVKKYCIGNEGTSNTRRKNSPKEDEDVSKPSDPEVKVENREIESVFIPAIKMEVEDPSYDSYEDDTYIDRPDLIQIKKEIVDDVSTEPTETTWMGEVKKEPDETNDEVLDVNSTVMENEPINYHELIPINVKSLCICNQKAAFSCPCKSAMYCSQSCQVNDWPMHRKMCSSVPK